MSKKYYSKKMIQTLWYRDISNTRNNRTYCFKNFKYIFRKIRKKNNLTIHKDFLTKFLTI